MADWLGRTTRFAYDADSNVITQTYPVSATAGYSYNGADQLTRTVDQYNGGQWSFGYGRNAVGQLASASDPLQSLQHTYSYDTLNRLTGDQRSIGTTT